MRLDKVAEHEDKTKRVFVIVVDNAEEERQLIDLVYRPAVAAAQALAKRVPTPKTVSKPKDAVKVVEDHAGRDKPKPYCRCKYCMKLRRA